MSDIERWDALKNLLRQQRDAARANAATEERPDESLIIGTFVIAYANVLQFMQNLESAERHKGAEAEAKEWH